MLTTRNEITGMFLLSCSWWQLQFLMFTFDQQKDIQKPFFCIFQTALSNGTCYDIYCVNHKGTNGVGLLVDMFYLGQKDRENERRLGTWHLTEVNFCNKAEITPYFVLMVFCSCIFGRSYPSKIGSDLLDILNLFTSCLEISEPG